MAQVGILFLPEILEIFVISRTSDLYQGLLNAVTQVFCLSPFLHFLRNGLLRATRGTLVAVALIARTICRT